MTCLNVNCAEIIGHVQTAIYQNIRTCGFWCKNFFSKLANYIDNWQPKYYIKLEATRKYMKFQKENHSMKYEISSFVVEDLKDLEGY